MSFRVVLDTSTLVSAALRVGSIPQQALLHAFGTCEICASQETLDELERVLDRAKFDAYLNQKARRKFVSRVRRLSLIVAVQEEDVTALAGACRDPADDMFLALALAAGAEVLVSSDDDLLALDPWRGLAILTPREFLARFGAPTDTKKQHNPR